ncbi:MAG TPA: hypothetical protein VGK10_06765 [Prolixibacteraceae bacterium]|jgi:hypothetical protein
MKQLFYLILVLFLFGCKGTLDDTTHYSISKTESKEYPVYLDMSEIGNIQVKANSTIVAPFKILSNDRYYFVGDKLKGLHVYEKKATGVSYLCFIACKYIKDFELADNRLFCNNLLDMVVLDVSDPLKISVLHRQKNHFNRFTSYKEYWDLPYVEGKGIVVGTETHELTGVVTDRQPNLDFSELDQLYGNLMTKVIPDIWLKDHLEYDAPSPEMIKVGADEIYTFGTYNSWAICTYRSGIFSVREEDLWTTPRGKYAPPYYYSNAKPVQMFLEDDIIFILGIGYSLSSGYCDCNLYDEKSPVSYQLYFPTFKPLDVSYMPQMNAFFALSGTSVWGVFIGGDRTSGFKMTYKDYQLATDAVEIFRVGDKLLTLGTELSVYAASENELSLVKKYPGISGKCCKMEGNMLTVANTQGLFVYDITDLENIHLIS